MSIEFVWPVPADLPAFAGHFPGQPIVPGVVILDRALGYVASWVPAPPASWQIAQAKFLAPAGPGDTLRFRLERRTSGAIAFQVEGRGGLVATGNLVPEAS
ncbi:MAG: hypothetical protein JNJ44_05425 [Zoogloeaceae bacterium]|nr:hypothetical protein [Zoogloeaceae bacterium]